MDTQVTATLEATIKSKIHLNLGWCSELYPLVTPVPLRLHHLDQLSLFDEYYIVEKHTGHSAFIYHGPEGLHWYGTDGKVRPLHLDNISKVTGETDVTILEAVWVSDKKTFYLNDAPIIRGRRVVYASLLDRLDFLRLEWMCHYKKSDRDRFVLAISQIRSARYLWELKSQNLTSFFVTSGKSVYRPGRNAKIWEWQNPSSLTLDLRLQWKKVDGMYEYSLWATSAEKDREICYCKLNQMTSSATPSVPSGSLFSCHYDPVKPTFSHVEKTWIKGTWTTEGLSKTSKQPAHVTTLWSKVKSMNENITFAKLCESFAVFFAEKDALNVEMDECIEWET